MKTYALEAPDAAEIIAALTAENGAHKNAAFAALEACDYGTKADIESVWPFSGHRAVLLWDSKFLLKKSAKSILRSKSAELERADGDKWRQLTSAKLRKSPTVDCVIAVRESHQTLELEVELVSEKSARYGQGRSRYPTTTPCILGIRFDDERPVVEITAGQVHARRALFCALDWLAGHEVPRKRCVEQADYLQPITFREDQVLSFARQNELGHTRFEGKDVRGIAGRVSFEGHENGEQILELDLNDKMIEAQHEAPNDERFLNFSFTHENGFVEKTEVGFRAKLRHPQIVFRRRTSLPAVRHIVSRFLGTL